jgi:hypothetical protein
MKRAISVSVNGVSHEHEVELRLLLVAATQIIDRGHCQDDGGTVFHCP